MCDRPTQRSTARERSSGVTETLAPSIEEMAPEDLPQVLAIELASYPRPWQEEAFLGELRNSFAMSLVARARPAGPVLGYAIGWLAADELQINNIAVETSQRRRGVARQLLTELMTRGRCEGARQAWLEVRRSNRAAMELYRSLGFTLRGVRPGYYSDNGEDALMLARAL